MAFDNELDNTKRKANMQVTCHSVLAARYRRLAFLLDISILGISVWLAALAFADEAYVSYLVPLSLDAKLTMGGIAIFVFLLSIGQLLLDWKQRAGSYASAAHAYSRIVIGIRHVQDNPNATDDEKVELLNRYTQVGQDHELIPDSSFNKLKRNHLLKVELSKLTETNPGVPIWVARTKIELAGIWRYVFGK